MVAVPSNSRLDTIGRVVRGGTAYLASTLVQRAVSFLMLPFYTLVVGPEAYGELSLLWSCTTVASVLLSFGLETAVFRGYFQHASHPESQKKYINTTGLFLLVVPNLGALLLGLSGSPVLSRWIALPSNHLLLGLLGASLYVSATVFPLAILRAQERLMDYVKINGLYLVVNTSLMVLLVLVLKMGATGWIFANLITAAALLPFSLRILGHRWSRQMEWQYLRDALAFGLPLLPHQLAHWMLSVSDRLILSAWVTLKELGIYGLGYQLGAVQGMVLTELNRAILTAYGRAIKDVGLRGNLAKVATYQALITGFLGLGMALIGPPMVHLVLPASYAGATDLLPWIALGQMFYGLYLIPMNIISMLVGDTKCVWVATVTGGLVNVLSNIVMIPSMGTLAAAINTSLGYIVLLLAILVYMVRRHGVVLDLEWGRIAFGLVLMAGGYAAAVYTTPGAPVPTVLLRSVWLVGLLLLLFIPELSSRQFREGLKRVSVSRFVRRGICGKAARN